MALLPSKGAVHDSSSEVEASSETVGAGETCAGAVAAKTIETPVNELSVNEGTRTLVHNKRSVHAASRANSTHTHPTGTSGGVDRTPTKGGQRGDSGAGTGFGAGTCRIDRADLMKQKPGT